MQIEVLPNVTIMKLHGNAIAYLYNDVKRTLSISIAVGKAILQKSG